MKIKIGKIVIAVIFLIILLFLGFIIKSQKKSTHLTESEVVGVKAKIENNNVATELNKVSSNLNIETLVGENTIKEEISFFEDGNTQVVTDNYELIFNDDSIFLKFDNSDEWLQISQTTYNLKFNDKYNWGLTNKLLSSAKFLEKLVYVKTIGKTHYFSYGDSEFLINEEGQIVGMETKNSKSEVVSSVQIKYMIENETIIPVKYTEISEGDKDSTLKYLTETGYVVDSSMKSLEEDLNNFK